MTLARKSHKFKQCCEEWLCVMKYLSYFMLNFLFKNYINEKAKNWPSKFLLSKGQVGFA